MNATMLLTIAITALCAGVIALIGRVAWDAIRVRSGEAKSVVSVHDNSATSHPDIRLALANTKLLIVDVLDTVRRIETKLNGKVDK